MKKVLFTLVIALATGIATMSATCWRINPSQHAGAKFKTVADAMNDVNVAAGDTLMLDPGSHGSISLNRDNITIIGAGYFLDKNYNWTEAQSTILYDVTLSKNSTIEGCTITNQIRLNDGITIKRCYFNGTYAPSDNWVNCRIEQCYVSGNNNTGICDVGTDWIIRNNIVVAPVQAITGSYRGNGRGSIIENNTLITENNYNYEILAIYNIIDATIRNNIIINSKTGFDQNQIPYAASTVSFTDNNIIQNNVFSTPKSYANTQYPNNLYVGATIENTFVNEGSDDAKWQLRNNSAAKGAATHGGDCGAFGGATPYVLSGIPQFLPHITEALIPAKPTDGTITVKLKIANQNE